MQCFGPKATLIPTNTVVDSTSATVGAIGLAMIAAAVILALPPGHDGKPTDHDLNRFAADLAVRGYEEARATRYHVVPRPPAEKLGPSENDD